jgi:predicted regulator of Ras-like GTPase activity (Roadblock/LC7/MglB family)
MKSMKEVLQGVCEKAQKEIPGLISMGVISYETGMSIAEKCLIPDFKSEVASAYGTRAITSCKNAVKAMSQKNELIEYLLFKDEFISISRAIGPKYWMGIALAPNANLGITRVLLKKFEEELIKALY